MKTKENAPVCISALVVIVLKIVITLVASRIHAYPQALATVLSLCYYASVIAFMVILGNRRKGLKAVSAVFIIEYIISAVLIFSANSEPVEAVGLRLWMSSFTMGSHSALAYLPAYFKPYSFLVYMAAAEVLFIAVGYFASKKRAKIAA